MLPTEPTHPLAAAPLAPHYTVLRGPFGLRAGWGLLLYLGILVALVAGINFVGHKVRDHHKKADAIAAARTGKPSPTPAPAARPDDSKPQPLVGTVVTEAILAGVVLLLGWLMAAIERRRVSAFGLGGAAPFSRFLAGAFWGLAAMALLIGLMRGFHFLSFDARLDHGLAIVGFGAAQLLGFFLVGLFEEYLFRGYIQYTLTRGMVGLGRRLSARHARTIAFWIAAIVTSAIFVKAHTGNPGENFMGLVSVFLAGLLLIVALWRTGSLWWAIGFHMTWDWSQSFLYGVPDSGGLVQGRLFATHPVGNPLFSGGTVGPEGSVLIVPVLLLAILVLVFTHPSPQPPLEPKSPPLPAEYPDEAPPAYPAVA